MRVLTLAVLAVTVCSCKNAAEECRKAELACYKADIACKEKSVKPEADPLPLSALEIPWGFCETDRKICLARLERQGCTAEGAEALAGDEYAHLMSLAESRARSWRLKTEIEILEEKQRARQR